MAAADVNGDHKADIVTGQGPGGVPKVKVFSGADGSLLANFLAYNSSFSGGVTVAAGDVNGDGHADIITGPGAGGAPKVKVFSGNGSQLLAQFTVGDGSFLGGLRVGFMDGGVVAAPGAGTLPMVQVYNAVKQQVLDAFFAYDPRLTSGVFVGGA